VGDGTVGLSVPCPHGCADRYGSLDGIVVLPEAEHLPPGRHQSRVGVAVTRDVAEDLLPPPNRVDLRPRYVHWAGVPEAPVDEDRDPCADEREIRPAAGAGQRLVDPIAQAKAACRPAPESPTSSDLHPLFLDCSRIAAVERGLLEELPVARVAVNA
jgi:hypothetical protein